MATKSPTTSVRSREVIGVDQFTQRREVFDKHDTVFLPLPSPTAVVPAYKEVDPIVTSNHGKTTSNFKRNAPTYSSMRESRTEERSIEFRTRKYSDNFTSEFNQNDDDVDYRRSMTERTRRLSNLRKKFLNSNLHEPTNDNPFARTGMRASMPANSGVKYKIESPNLYKFPFAEPYATPPPIQKVYLNLGSSEINEKENRDPDVKPKHINLPNNDNTSPKIDHQKLFEELVKRYSPQRKPVDWTLPPTRPRVVGSVPKSVSSVADGVDNVDKKFSQENISKYEDDDVFTKKDINLEFIEAEKDASAKEHLQTKHKSYTEILTNGTEISHEEVNDEKNLSKTFLVELEENNDKVPELSNIQKQNKEVNRNTPEKYTDITIPGLIEKMTEDGEDLESQQQNVKKVKRKRSFLDKLLGRKKDK